MQIEEFLDLVKKRRSIRRFKPDPVPDEYIEKILQAGRWAMSGSNAQPWEFIVIRQQQTREKLAQVYQEGRKLGHELEQTRVESSRYSLEAAHGEAPAGFLSAPVLIAVCGDLRTIQASMLATNLLGETNVFHSNIANTNHNIQLAAALGLASQWVTISHIIEGQMRAILGVPDVFRLLILVPIGYPAYTTGPGYRRELSEIVHYEKYDQSKYRTHAQVTEYIARLREKTKPTHGGHGQHH